jgi:hypothetical protein
LTAHEGLELRGRQVQISYIELDKDLEVDKVCDIFTQINSRGVRLDVFDLVHAGLSDDIWFAKGNRKSVSGLG